LVGFFIGQKEDVVMVENQNNAAHRENEKKCWNCKYQKHYEVTTLFGICTWFSHNGKKDKEIPKDKAEIGCKFFIPK
jgi:hypothetical protein